MVLNFEFEISQEKLETNNVVRAKRSSNASPKRAPQDNPTKKVRKIVIQDKCKERTCTPTRVHALFNGKKDTGASSEKILHTDTDQEPDPSSEYPLGPANLVDARRFCFVP